MAETGGYQVLARKYRPGTFADLIGQEAMVRTLRGAFAQNRIAQAFMLTGIRGIGKTTTARIIAKGLNCTGPDGTRDTPTTEPCGTCPQCRGIAAGRHIDVIELDAASNTQVDVIRAQILDSVAYAPSESRFKVYIIDEVHMLSTSSFNALLKTLEEPPAHVKFIFATTEIRKVPVTVLSRCQRFDLRRIEPEEMVALLRRIADAEGAAVEDGALALIARAAEGSARDATSLLDQAIGHGAGGADAETVRAMLGLADRGRVLDLFERIMEGDAAGALAELGAQYAAGADPEAVLRDLAETTHWLSVAKITPETAEDPALAPDARDRSRQMAARLSQRVLGRAWQMLLKALEETAAAPNPMMAAEMAVIRLTHVADLPPPEDLLRRLEGLADGPGTPASASAPAAGAGAGTAAGSAPASAAGSAFASASDAEPVSTEIARAAPGARRRQGASSAASGSSTGPAPAAAPRPVPVPAVGVGVAALPDSFEGVIALIRQKRDIALLIDVEAHIHLVAYAPGRITFRPGAGAPADLAQRLAERLKTWTGQRWAISVTETEPGAPTLAQDRRRAQATLEQAARMHPHVAAILDAVPGATIAAVRSRQDVIAQAAQETGATGGQADPDRAPDTAGPDADWDPFETD